MPPPPKNHRGAPIEVSGLNVVIRVSRFIAPHVITAIFPIIATTWLAFLVFFLPRKEMEARCAPLSLPLFFSGSIGGGSSRCMWVETQKTYASMITPSPPHHNTPPYKHKHNPNPHTHTKQTHPYAHSLGAITALFLALAAIQFVVSDGMPASSYVTAQQQLVLLSYVILILVGLENVLIWFLTIYHKDKQR